MMEDVKLSYMPIWIDDFSGAMTGLSGQHRGLYLVLLMAQWVQGELPSNPRDLAEYAGYDFRVFSRLWPALSKKFVHTEAGLLNLKLEEVREKSKQLAAFNKQRAKAAVKARELKKAESASPRSSPRSSQRSTRGAEHESILEINPLNILRSKRLTNGETGHG